MNKKQKKTGFSLIELVVVFGLLTVVSVIGARLFSSVFKTTAKANHIAQVKQEGEYAMETMARVIRNAQSVSAVTTCTTDGSVSTNQVTVVNPDGTETSFSVGSYTAGNKYIASNTAQLTSQKVNIGKPGIWTDDIFVCTQVYGRPPAIDVEFLAAYYEESETANEQGTEINFINKFSLRTY